jgi:hypothetical protein
MIFLGTIANVGSDVLNNTNTAAPFTIPTWVQVLRLQPSAATQMAAATLASNGAFAPAATDMLQLGAANSIADIPIARTPGVGIDHEASGPVTLAVRKTDVGAGTCKVFALGRS